MEHTAAVALPQHSHTWGPIQHDDPPAYLVSAHGPRAFAGTDRRYRACTGRGCDERVYGADVVHPSVLAQLAPLPALDATPDPRLSTAGASA